MFASRLQGEYALGACGHKFGILMLARHAHSTQLRHFLNILLLPLQSIACQLLLIFN